MGLTAPPKMEQLCRVCMSSSVTLVEIFAGPQPELASEHSLAEMLTECADCEVERDDDLPQHICMDCVLATRNAFCFKRQCEQSYRQLCELLSGKERLTKAEEQLHQCPLCARQFARLQLMQRHLVVKHKEIEEEKEVPGQPSEAEGDEAEAHSDDSEAICEMPIEPAAYEELETEDRLADSELEVSSIKIEMKTEEQPSNGFIEVLFCDDRMESTIGQPTAHANAKEAEKQQKPEHSNAEATEASKSSVGQSKRHHCDICGRRFTTRLYLARHQILHQRKRYACKECATSYGTRDELAAHIKDQGHDKPMLCPECGLRCKTSHTLMVHMRRHNGEKPFKCKFCSKGFPRMDDLRVHEKYHTGEKSHFCETCGKGFLRKYNLTIHMRVHTGERPYKCPHCPQAFAQGNDLKAHIRRHTGERFRCEYCHAAFLQHYKIRQHKLLQHGIKEDAPTQRVEKFTSVEEQQQQIERNLQQKPG